MVGLVVVGGDVGAPVSEIFPAVESLVNLVTKTGGSTGRRLWVACAGAGSGGGSGSRGIFRGWVVATSNSTTSCVVWLPTDLSKLGDIR